jgi:hypothetical protein
VRELERSRAACGEGGGDEESSPARGEADVNQVGVGEPGFANFLVPHRILRKKTTALNTFFRYSGHR